MSSKPRDPWTWVLVFGYVLVALLLLVPLATIFGHAFLDPETHALSLVNLREVATQPTYRLALGRSLLVATGGALGALALGLPLAYLLSRFEIPGKRVLSALAVLSLLSPPFIGAYAWVLLLGQAGVLRQLGRDVGLELPTIYGPSGIVLVFATQYYPFVFLLARSAFGSVDRSVEEAAASLGASPWRRFRRVTLPLVAPSVSAGVLLAFLMSLANFGSPMVLGRGYRVLPTLAYDLFTSELSTRPGLAASVCLLLVGVSSIALAAQVWVSRRNVASDQLARPRVERLSGGRQVAAVATCYGIVALSTLPLAVVVACSFRNTSGPVFQPGFGLDSYRAVFAGVPRAIGNSLLFSLVATAGIVVVGALLGVAVARLRGVAARALDGLLLLPYLVPGLVLGMGFTLVAASAVPALLGSAAILILAYGVRRLPYSVRANAGILAQIDPSVEEAAASLGAPPANVFARVTLPLMTPGIVAGAMLAWVTSINELSASIVLYTGDTITLPIKVYLAVLDGSTGPASALATILLVATGAALFVIEWVRGAGGDELYG